MSKVKGYKKKFSKTEKCDSTNCSSKSHGDKIYGAITLKNSTDDQIISYMTQLCSSFSTVLDSDKRTALHNAVLAGKNKVVKYLLASGADVNLHEEEHGFTPLHFAAVSGHVGIGLTLIKHGANTELKDKKGLTAIHYIYEIMQKKDLSGDKLPMLHAYCWGTNSNYNLGLPKVKSTDKPEHLDLRLTDGEYFVSVSMNKFHSVFLTNTGSVYCCGHAQGGRLGLNTDSAAILPARIQSFKYPIIMASAGVDHTVFLTESGIVYSCGMNQYHQLGLYPLKSEVSNPHPLSDWHSKYHTVKVRGVAAAAYHTVIWTDEEIFACGLNAGQMGHLKTEEKYIDLPLSSPFIKTIDKKRVGSIVNACVSNGATVFATDLGEVFVCSNYLVRRILSLTQLYSNIISSGFSLKCACIGGFLDFHDVSVPHLSKNTQELSVAVLVTSSCKLVICKNDMIYAVNNIIDFCLNESRLCIINENGEGCVAFEEKDLGVFTGVDNNSKSKVLNVNFLDMEEITFTEKIPSIYRGYSISSDPKGNNYFVFQYDPKTFLTQKVKSFKSRFTDDLANFYDGLRSNSDNYDTEIIIEGKKFACNALILSYYSNTLYAQLSTLFKEKSLCIAHSDEKVQLELNGVDSEVFQKLLLIMYRVSKCDLDHPEAFWYSEVQDNDNDSDNDKVAHLVRRRDGSIIDRQDKRPKFRRKGTANGAYPVKPIVDAINVLKMGPLQEAIIEANKNELETGSNSPHFNFYPDINLSRLSFQEFLDVSLKTSDGQVFWAHKCLLIARSEYFSAMLGLRWMESDTVQISVPSSVLDVILDFLYTDTSFVLQESLDLTFLCEVLRTAHLFMLPELLILCQSSIFKCLTLRNAFNLLRFSQIYNAEELTNVVLHFICLNMNYYFNSKLKNTDFEMIDMVDAKFSKLMLPHDWSSYDLLTDDNKPSPSSPCLPDDLMRRRYRYKFLLEPPEPINISSSDNETHEDDFINDYTMYMRFSDTDSIEHSPPMSQITDKREQGSYYALPGLVSLKRYLSHTRRFDLPTLDDLIEALNQDSSVVNQDFNDWLPSEEEVFQKHCVDHKTAARCQQRKKSSSKRKPRKTSNSSGKSESSNSESEGPCSDKLLSIDQFSFDDLEDRMAPAVEKHQEGEWQHVDYSREKKYRTPPENDKGIADRNESTIVSVSAVVSSASEAKCSPQSAFVTPQKSDLSFSPFPTLHESFSSELKKHTPQKKMPKFIPKKKKIIVSSPENDLAPSSVSSCPWGKNSTTNDVVTPLVDVMKSETESSLPAKSSVSRNIPIAKSGHAKNVTSERGFSRSLNECSIGIMETQGEYSKRRGKGGNTDSPVTSGSFNNSSFYAIVEEELLYKRTVEFQKSKPLPMIQHEEEAMKQLLEFYGGEFNPEETVSVKRLGEHLEKPSWNVPKRSSN